MTLPIACAITGEYTLPLLVMLASLKAHLRPAYRPVLYLLHQRLREDQLASVSRLVETHTIVPNAASLAAIPPDSRFPPEAAYPLLLAELLPETLERVLFLDADLLVLDDVAALWETETGDRVLAAAPDSAIPLCSSPRGVKRIQEWGIPEAASYFNAGVMLIRLTEWRERRVTQRAHDYLRKMQGNLDFLHQEALNAVLWDAWVPVDGRWNLLATLAGRPYEQPKSESWKNPGIVHFAGRMKPWRIRTGGPFDGRYRVFLSQVAESVPPIRPTLRDKLLSFYDRRWRQYLYPFERALWKRRLL